MKHSLFLFFHEDAATVNTPEVSFSNVVYSASNDATSVDITFPQVIHSASAFSSLFFIIHSMYYFVLISHQPVLSFPLQRLQLRDGEANPISLATATLTPKAGNTVWTLSKSSGFLPYAYPLPSPLSPLPSPLSPLPSPLSSQPCSMLCLLF